MQPRRFTFGSIVFDTGRGTLFDGETPVAVGNKGLALLQALVEARGQVVTKAALMDAAWPNTSVEESNLTVQIAQLRKRLGTSSDSEEWIATVPRTGYRFVGELRLADDASAPRISGEQASQHARKASIAVLPFNNMSSDQEQEYFAEGLSEDLITDLSKIPGLLVIARNSSFAYKGAPLDVRRIGRELDVRYVIEGSVRRAASRVRITAQLIDATDNSHLWADRFDRDLADIFALQDEIVGRILNALAGALPSTKPPSSRRVTNLKAYDLFVRGRALVTQSRESNRAARTPLERSIELDPGFAEANAWLAMSHVLSWTSWGEVIEPHRSIARTIAKRAVALDPQNSDAHWILGYVRAYEGELTEGIAEFETALRINPNHADAWALSADLKVFEGLAVEGIDRSRNAFRLNPYPPGFYYQVLGWCQYAAGRYQDCVETLQHDAARGTASQYILAASLAQLGQAEDARREAREFLAIAPNFTVGQWARTRPFKHEAHRQHFVEGYIKAGLPM